MNLDVEDLLRSGMERLTDQVQAPQGLAGRAVAAHRRHRRRRTAAAVAGVTVAVATAFVVAVTGAGLAPARTGTGGTGVHTVGYMLNRVVGALRASDAVVQTRTTFAPAFPAITQWSYRGQSRNVQSGHVSWPGVPWADGQQSWAAGTAVIGGKRTNVEVDYRHRRWYPTPPVLPALNGCSNALDLAQYGTGPVNWTVYIRQALACGTFKVAGRGVVGGHQVIKITGWERRPSWLGRNALFVTATLYVDASTYRVAACDLDQPEPYRGRLHPAVRHRPPGHQPAATHPAQCRAGDDHDPGGLPQGADLDVRRPALPVFRQAEVGSQPRPASLSGPRQSPANSC